jgi:hypothetical protein
MNKATFIECIQEIMPEGCEITDTMISAGYDIRISWLLHDDPERPNKRSKTILVSIDKECISDMEALNDEQSKEAIERFRRWLETMYREHDPSNNNSRDAEPPLVKWVVKCSYIIG